MKMKKYLGNVMEAQLHSFLTSHRIKKGEPFTHTTREPSGSYYIGDDSIEQFYTIYCNSIRHCKYPTITEKPGAYGPLRVDFDFKASLDVGLKRQYDDDIISKIIGFYQEELRAAISEDIFEEKMLWCILLEKSAPRVEEGVVKDGFHLHFPYFICEGWFQDEYLRLKITEKMVEHKIWEKANFLVPVDKFIDINMAKKVWLMYGSSKSTTKAEPFLASKVFDENLDKISLEKAFAEQMKGKKIKAPEYYLPRFLSIRGYTEMTDLKPEIEARRAAYKTKKSKKMVIIKKRSMEEVLEDIKTIKDGEIMQMLSDDRVDDYNSWIDVGWTLFNIGQGCDETLQLWIDFSKRSSKFVEGECEEQWGKMEMRDKTIGSLLAMARTDSPDLYKEWKDTNVKMCLYQSLSEPKPNEWDVAQVVGKLYKDRFICADAKKDIWYEFKNHRWQCMDDGIALKNLLATEIVDLYYKLKAELGNKQITETDAREKLEKQMAKCVKIITALKTVQFQTNVIKMCKIVFHDPFFFRKLDENKLLWVCENGVLDLEIGLFRDGRPDDYMSLSCNLNYQKYGKDDDEYRELKEYFRKVFVNRARRSYFKDAACAAMEGGNINKIFIVGTGGGDNAKTVTYSLLEMAFGEYCFKFPRELLIIGKTNSSSGARPELARVRGKRLGMIQEIAKTETLNIGVLKDLTGNDSFFARGLYEKGGDIKPMFTLFLQCLCKGTPVSLPGGISMPIESLKNNSKVLAWDSKTNGLIPAKQKRFLEQGVKECVTVTLLDGTELTCTPDHRFLDSDGNWIEAQNIIIGETNLTMGVHQPCYDLNNESSNGYKFGKWNLETLDGKLKSMTASRLLGYGLADGTLNRTLYLGHILDAEQVVRDIEFLTNKTPVITKNKNCYQVAIPSELGRFFDEISPPQKGGRLRNPMYLPKFLFEEKCPDFLIREFIAGMIGGDGLVPCIQKHTNCSTSYFSPIQLIASKVEEHVESLIYEFGRLSKLLNDRFGIKSFVNPPVSYEEGKSKVLLAIHVKSARKYIENIGVRYCCHKSYRLTAVLSYRKYLDSVLHQNEKIVQRTKELVEKYEKQNPIAKILQLDENGNILETFGSTQKAQHKTGINHSLICTACKRNGTSGGYSWRFSYDSEPIVGDEPGCKTIKNALKQALNEEEFFFDEDSIVTYSQVRRRITKGENFTRKQFNKVVEYLEMTGLNKFCNNGTKVNYSVKADSTSLPIYIMPVVSVKKSGKYQVYDLTVETPYSNYVSNGLISHNCNEPPGVPGHDEATWNRIRVVDFESKFVKPEDMEKYPVSNDEKEQFRMKRFKADLTFKNKFPELAPVLLSMLFDRRKKYKQRGLKEPKEVRLSTNMYRANNDVYLQFIQDRIEEITYPKNTPVEKMTFLKLPDLYAEFTSWYQENYSSYREKFNKIGLMHEFNKKFSNSGKQGRVQGWYGYKICDEEITDEKQRKLQEILGGKNSDTLEKENVTPIKKSAKKSVSAKTSKTAKLKKKSSNL